MNPGMQILAPMIARSRSPDCRAQLGPPAPRAAEEERGEERVAREGGEGGGGGGGEAEGNGERHGRDQERGGKDRPVSGAG